MNGGFRLTNAATLTSTLTGFGGDIVAAKEAEEFVATNEPIKLINNSFRILATI
jgi:hypothetical protein